MEETRLLTGAHDRLEAHECFYRALVQQVPDVVTVIDESGSVIFTSASSRRLLGHRPEASVGRSVFDAIHPDDVARVKAAFASTLKSDEGAIAVEYRCRRADGEWQVFEGVARRSYDDTGAPIVIAQSRAVHALMPLDTRRSDEEALEAVARISAAIARDVNDVFAELGHHTRILESSPSTSARATVRAMRRTLDRGRVLVDQLMAFDPRDDAREDAHTDVNEVIEAAAHDLERLTGEHGEVTYLLGASPACVALGRSSLALVLVALVQHACRPAIGGSRLTISTRNVADDDRDIQAAAASVVIEINNPAQASASSPAHGTDNEAEAGLYAAHSIVRHVHGHITTSSDSLTGTTVQASLPLSTRS